MPPHLAHGGLYRHRPVAKHTWTDLHTGSDMSWPVNEVVLRSLILAGKSDAQIAADYGVTEGQVLDLRRAHEL